MPAAQFIIQRNGPRPVMCTPEVSTPSVNQKIKKKDFSQNFDFDFDFEFDFDFDFDFLFIP